MKIVRVHGSESESVRVRKDSDELRNNDRDDAYESSPDSTYEEEDRVETPNRALRELDSSLGGAEQDVASPTAMQPLPKKSFAELQKAKFQLFYQKPQ